MEDELTGILVAIHPDTSFDPANMQGKIGIITSADLEADDFYVSFGKGEQARYPSGTLLVLREGSEIYQDLLTRHKELEKQDFKNLFEINLLQQKGSAKSIKDAMNIALKSDTLLTYGMTTLQDKLGIEAGIDISQEQKRRMSVVR